MPGFLCFGDPHRRASDCIWTRFLSFPSCSESLLAGTQTLAVSMAYASLTHSWRREEGLAALRSSQKPGIPLGASGMSPTCIEFPSFLPLPESGLKLNLSI